MGYFFSFFFIFQSSFSDVIFSFPVIFICKRFNFCCSLLRFLFLYDLTLLLQRIESIYYLFHWWDLLLLVVYLLLLGESIYDPPCLKSIYNVINEHSQIWNHYLSLMFPIQFDMQKEVIKKFFCNFICFIINHNFYVVTFWMHYTVFIIIFKRHKLSKHINVETMLIVNVHQRCFNVDIWLKIKVEPTYIYRRLLNVGKTTLKQLR